MKYEKIFPENEKFIKLTINFKKALIDQEEEDVDQETMSENVEDHVTLNAVVIDDDEEDHTVALTGTLPLMKIATGMIDTQKRRIKSIL